MLKGNRIPLSAPQRLEANESPQREHLMGFRLAEHENCVVEVGHGRTMTAILSCFRRAVKHANTQRKIHVQGFTCSIRVILSQLRLFSRADSHRPLPILPFSDHGDNETVGFRSHVGYLERGGRPFQHWPGE
jgi:hypothetical protein